ncbi:hypothetical protein D0869_01466 [Hortaea werneckii]|uniref:DUF7907 domain-containing protein n=1 Tax=Hortaea werneckii TaxID=91943 RepID=A0A3M6XCT9_HORWE|nr:hypothetical protein D0869_01466 [Hortaea werneckii]
MKFQTGGIVFAFSTMIVAGLAQVFTNQSQEYNLQTCLKPGQAGKERFEGLWLVSYHTGAGLGDATFIEERTAAAAKGFWSRSMAFNLGNAFPWQMIMAQNVNFYADWQPVRINAGLGTSSFGTTSGFYINDTGLQWSSSPGSSLSSLNAFGGWLVCEWWHGVPQLFFRKIYDIDTPAPCSCADVYLKPVYI